MRIIIHFICFQGNRKISSFFSSGEDTRVIYIYINYPDYMNLGLSYEIIVTDYFRNEQ